MIDSHGHSLLADAPVLAEALRTKSTWTQGGVRIPLSSGITLENAERLHSVVCGLRPNRALEIGMAHGISTIAILAGLANSGEGTLTSIDPLETELWQGAGLELVRRSGWAGLHRHIAEPDYFALPSLLKGEFTCELAYIDGMHSFEFTFLDFFYLDRMLTPGGLIGFNDCGMPAVAKVIAYIASHTPYLEEYHQPVSLLRRRRLRFWEYPDRWFRKTREHAIPWDYYKAF